MLVKEYKQTNKQRRVGKQVRQNVRKRRKEEVFVVQRLEHNLFTVETWIRVPSEITDTGKPITK